MATSVKREKIGVFGGTFDPIHYGHLRLAEEARERIGLDRVFFVPNQVSPFKLGKIISDGALRAEMVQLAIGDNGSFQKDCVELERSGPSYTVETLRAIQQKSGANADLYFLTGADAVRDLPRWREPEEMLRIARFVAATRPGVSRDEIVAALPPAWQERILFLDMTELDISSTDLRERVRTGRSLRYLTPPSVEAMIAKHNLYRAEPMMAGAPVKSGE